MKSQSLLNLARHLMQPCSLVLSTVVVLCCYATAQAPFVFCCKADNDLYQVVSKQLPDVKRYHDAAQAVSAAPKGSAVLILAGSYPQEVTPLGTQLFEQAARKKLRLFVEYPGFLPGVKIGKPVSTKVERAVIASDRFGGVLKKQRIVSINGLHYLQVDLEDAHIVAARVAGFDEAVYGMPTKTAPLLCELPGHEVLVATTKLSCFVTGRYAPQEAWREIWHAILSWLAPRTAIPELTWTPIVRASYGPDEQLPKEFELQAIKRGLAWGVSSPAWWKASYGDDNARYVRVKGKSLGRIPEGFKAAGKQAWLFVDELFVNAKKN